MGAEGFFQALENDCSTAVGDMWPVSEGTCEDRESADGRELYGNL